MKVLIFATAVIPCVLGSGVEETVSLRRDLKWNPLAALNAGFSCAIECGSSLLDDFKLDPSQECWECIDKYAQFSSGQLPPSYFRDIVPLRLGKFYTPWWCGNAAGVDMEANPTGWILQDDGSYTGCEVANDFPGTGTTSHQSHSKVIEELKTVPKRQFDEDIWRGNELGMIISNEIFWPTTIVPRGVMLGASPKQHQVIRPILMRLFSQCDAACEQRLSESAIEFQNREAINVQADIKGWVHEELFKIIFPGKANPWPTKEFIDLQSSFTTLSTITQILEDPVTRLISQSTISKAKNLYEAYKPLVAEVYGAELFQQDCAPSLSCLDQMTSAIIDTLIAAGGLSVPGGISTGLWALYGDNTVGQAEGKFENNIKLSEVDATAFFYESLRFFAPVVGFPFWTTPPKRATDESASQADGGIRVTLNLALANKDPNAWGAEAHKFRVRDLGEYHSKFVGFADFANDDTVADGKMNRSCPGKALALQMGKHWFKNWNQNAWCTTDKTVYKETAPFIEEFTLIKGKRLGDDCTAPSILNGNKNECCEGECKPTIMWAGIIPRNYKCLGKDDEIKMFKPEEPEEVPVEEQVVSVELTPAVLGGFAVGIAAAALGFVAGKRRRDRNASPQVGLESDDSMAPHDGNRTATNPMFDSEDL